MLRRIVESLANLFGLLTGRDTKSIEAKLEAIEERLGRIEDKIEEQRKFAVYTFLYGLGMSGVAIGVAIRQDHALSGLVLMGTGIAVILGVVIVLGIPLVRRLLRRP